MIELGTETVDALARGEIYHAKLVFNHCGFIAFPTSRQHNTMKAEGISYEDNYVGNAMAAILKPGAIEVRFHRDFSDQDVGLILTRLMKTTALATLGPVAVTYKRRPIHTEAADEHR